jgi:hypothetical protein
MTTKSQAAHLELAQQTAAVEELRKARERLTAETAAREAKAREAADEIVRAKFEGEAEQLRAEIPEAEAAVRKRAAPVQAQLDALRTSLETMLPEYDELTRKRLRASSLTVRGFKCATRGADVLHGLDADLLNGILRLLRTQHDRTTAPKANWFGRPTRGRDASR